MNRAHPRQYPCTRPVAAHMFTHYDGVLKVGGEVGNKKAYDPRAWGKAAAAGMGGPVVGGCEKLTSTGTRRTGRPGSGAPGCGGLPEGPATTHAARRTLHRVR